MIVHNTKLFFQPTRKKVINKIIFIEVIHIGAIILPSLLTATSWKKHIAIQASF